MDRKPWRIMLLAMVALVLASSTACTRIKPGYGGIVVDLNGEDRGVDEITVKTGRIWYNPIGKTVYQLPFFMQRVVWTKDPAEGSPDNEEITFNSVEGTVIKTDVGFAWAVKQERIPQVFVKLRTSVADITDGFMRSQVRGAIAECAEDRPLDLIYGAQKSDIADCAFRKLGESEFISENFDLEYLTFVGAFRFDAKVQNAINVKIAAENEKKAAIQKAEGEARAAELAAEGKARARIALATAERDAMFLAAEGNERLRKSLDEMVLSYRKLELMESKWDGVLPRVQAGGGGGTFLQISAD